MKTTWNAIVAGVDGSPQSARAAGFAWRLAQTAGAQCRLVHAVPNPWDNVPPVAASYDMAAHVEDYLSQVQIGLERQLKHYVPDAALEMLDIDIGRAAPVLTRTAQHLHADLVVLGGKHHTALERWFSGSTAHHLVRTLDTPLLVVGDLPKAVDRILVAVDGSSSSHVPVHAACRLAKLLNARMRAVHVVEPLPIMADFPAPLQLDEAYFRSERNLEAEIWPMFDDPTAEVIVRRGPAADTIRQAAIEWQADIVVVGSHGKGWVDRLLIGSTTERLLNALPASLYVIPAYGHTARATAPAAAVLQEAR
jgi:nucleotide-binding universal stress UspA family protein